MSRFVRPSKYRHVFGQPARKENCIENVKISLSAWDSNLINASALYVSLNWASSGGGAFAILPVPSPFAALPHAIPTKLPDIVPLARGHSATVLDTAWSPFNDSVCASGGEDGKILIWKVEASEFDNWGAEKWTPKDFEPVSRIVGSARKIGQVTFHPTASHVLAAASGDHVVKLWNLENTDSPTISFKGHGDTIQGLAFNHTGTVLGTTCRDRKLRLFDSRTGGEPVRVTDGHSGIKGSRIVWIGEKDRIATTGFSKMSDRQLAVWETGSLKSVTSLNVDQSAGVVMPFWSDNGILFLAGKGDGNIRYYEFDADSLYLLSEYKSSDPQRGIGFLPRRALNIAECEIARAFKVAGSAIEPIAFIVPRKADSFQSDIFPPAPSLEPSLTASEFFAGKSAPPKLVELDTGTIRPSPAEFEMLQSPPPPGIADISSVVGESGVSGDSRAHSQAEKPSLISATVSAPMPAPPEGASLSNQESTTTSPRDNNYAELQAENELLQTELREAKAKIRVLELQVETMRANAQRATKALQLE